MNVKDIVLQGKGTIIDVRTPQEYSGGNVVDSINIPLQEIPQRIAELQSIEQPFILCCASGNRSGQATEYLTKQGFECYNGGAWMDVNFYQSQKI